LWVHPLVDRMCWRAAAWQEGRGSKVTLPSNPGSLSTFDTCLPGAHFPLPAATVLWIPLRTYQYIVRHSISSSGAHAAGSSPLGDLALSLLLVLAHYPAHHAGLTNGVREGLRSLQDVQASADTERGRGMPTPASSMTPTASFARMYDFFATGGRDRWHS
jgi:hypothetical protein